MRKLLTLALPLALALASCADGDSSDTLNLEVAPDGTGALSGSYARLLKVGDYIYAVDDSGLITYDATNPSSPAFVTRSDVGFAIETLYHHEGHLFIGSQRAMYTYTIGVDGVPARRGQFDYASLNLPVEPCDPVVADGSTAFATLYTDLAVEGPCGGTEREQVEALVVMDIQNLDAPRLVAQYDTPSPRGLSLDGDILFVCNETEGFTVFDVSDPRDVTEIARVEGVTAWDAIANDGVLAIVGAAELVQYDYSDPSDPVELGRIDIAGR